jgi:hypothetical protein
MNPYGANPKDPPPLRRDDRYRTEIHRRSALPFHHTASPRASHDLLVMNQRPDLAHEVGTAPDATSLAGGLPV